MIRFSTSMLALSAAFLATPAIAQTAEAPAENEDQGGIQEIVVTAQKRAENVQDVPIAISAFGAETLNERAVGDVSALSAVAPNVNLDAGTPFSGSSAVLSAYVRGIGSDDFAFNIDPGVGIYLDGVYLARTVGANQELMDVERVEILKGPQGTLFGRNTIGGAISIVTAEPTAEFKGKADLTVGSFNLFQARGALNVPIAPNLNGSLSFNVKTREGHLKRLPYPDQRANNSPSFNSFSAAGYDSAGSEGSANTWNLRGKLKWDDGGPLRVTLSGDYSRDRGTSANKLLATAEFVPGNFAGTANLPGTAFDPTGTTGFLFAGLYNFCIGSTGAQIAARNAQALCGVTGTQFNPQFQIPSFASVNVDGNPANDRLPWDNRYLSGVGVDESYATGNSYSRLENWGFAGTIDFDLNDHLTLKSITAYRQLGWNAGLDADGSPLNFLQLSFTMNQWQFSQEVQLTGTAANDTLNYVVGGYYFKEKGDLHDYVTFAEGLIQVDGPNDLQTENYAFFGQIDWRPIDLVGITIGGRYTSEKKQFEGGQQELNGFNYRLFGCAAADGTISPLGNFPLAPPVGAGGPPCGAALEYPDFAGNPVRVYVPGVNRKTFKDFSPKFGIQLHPSEDMMVYGSYSRGYKTGGWTTRLTNPQGNVAPDFDEEVAKTWEAGVKSTLFDRRLQLNAAVFSTDYENIQLNIQVGTSPTIANAGDARIRGFEVEAIIAPTNGLTINAALGFVDAKYTAVSAAASVPSVGGPNGFQAGTIVGTELPKTPKWKANISPRYEFNLGNGGSMVVIADWSYSSSAWNDTGRNFTLKRDAAHLFNGSVSYRGPGERWSLTVGGTNLSDKRFITSGGANVAAGAFFGTYNRPREFYLRFGYEF